MRAAAILGLGCSPKGLAPFQDDQSVEWRLGMPTEPGEVDIILLFGGDGTIHRHLGQLVKLNTPVLIVPAGSGNDFARALGLPRVRDSLSAWKQFQNQKQNVRPIDLGLITPVSVGEQTTALESPRDSQLGTRYFCCVAGVGLDGEVARRANRLPRWLRSHGGYVLTLAPSLFTFAPLPMRISTHSGTSADGWQLRINEPTMLASFANTSTYGGGMKIAPQAKTDDGLLDICIVKAIDRFKLLRLFPTVYSGAHLSIREVEYFQTPMARVETEHPLDIYADGEYVCQTPAQIAIQQKALRVVVPKRHPD